MISMKYHTKKQIRLLLMGTIVALAVFFLFPFGNKLLLAVRSQPSYEIEGSKEVIYSYIDKGDISVADRILLNKYELSRFEPVEINTIKWDEDPYSDIYWRFNFYNLEPVRHLLYAWRVTGDSRYKDKLIEITDSFVNTGMNGQYSWDLHGVAFRTMTFVDVWWKLHDSGLLNSGSDLPENFNTKMLETLEIHGDFLADTDNYEESYNHGLDQSAALYLLAVNFPDLPNAKSWFEISSSRINNLLSEIVDDDGVLVENSPYYHFYVLEKFWEINKYLKQNGLFISPLFDEKIDKMISYASYILQPDLGVPTIGASLKGDIKLAGVYREMARSHPDLLFVLTRGADGIQPEELNLKYSASGQTIMRSGWGDDDSYDKQTQLIFDVGSYRTNHSDLDALSFSLYGNGLTLMPDVGLYTYDPGPHRAYFHGTRAHNTVVVDGKDQNAGEITSGGLPQVYAGTFEEGDGYAYQSGTHELYQGVSHKRAIAMIEGSTILIFDALKASQEHTYEQMFHLFPGAHIDIDGTTVVAKGDKSEHTLTIQQYITDGVEINAVINKTDPLDGICSFEYKKTVPCYSLSYVQRGKDVSYVTAISLGNIPAKIEFDEFARFLKVTTENNAYDVFISETEGSERRIDVNKNFDISYIYSAFESESELNSFDKWHTYERIIATSSGDEGIDFLRVKENKRVLEIIPPQPDTYFEVVRDADLDLSKQTLLFKVKVDDTSNLQNLFISFSNKKWEESATYDLRDGVFAVTDIYRDNEWFQFGLGKSDSRGISFGSWTKSSPSFDWSKIDSVKFIVRAEEDKSIVVDVKEFNLVPDQKEPRAVIIFDDGWASVMDAANIMNKYGVKGNVAVITGSIGHRIYLSLDELKTLQNSYNWDIVNHTSFHKNATVEYVNKSDMTGYEADVTDALQYMIKNNINSAPNWFIYPHGKTGESIKRVIGKYYKFARATIDSPEAFPFAEPLEVKIFSAYSDRANVTDIHNAISDAIKYNQTIMIMFHKFSEGSPTVFTEWQLSELDAVLKDIKEQGIKVVTLSELDRENGIPDTEFIVHATVPQQFKLDITVTHTANGFSKFIEGMISKFK
jgi:peptidoglycan/xylan/chitin deacetylase (PgdA/CDA1 family)